MAQIFVSHSRRDQEGKQFLNQLFGASDHKLYWYEWEGQKAPHAPTIRAAIQESAAAVVMSSVELGDHPRVAWTGFEVGLAMAAGKNVWVIENPDWPMRAPVPHVTGYIHRPKRLVRKDTFPFNSLASSAGAEIPTSNAMAWPGGVVCPVDKCRANYHVYLDAKDSFYCPVCRFSVSTKGGQLKPSRWTGRLS
jgi:hypothetical protein